MDVQLQVRLQSSRMVKRWSLASFLLSMAMQRKFFLRKKHSMRLCPTVEI
jgi:hypothetical protein